MVKWIKEKATNNFDKNHPTYLGPHVDQPFPSNPLFRSQSVLSESMKNRIYTQVMDHGVAMKAVSEEMQVDVRRVAAVVRLKELENHWKLEVSLPSSSQPDVLFSHPYLPIVCNDETIINFRLVLKTPTWLNYFFFLICHAFYHMLFY